jgi:hypothetical protein
MPVVLPLPSGEGWGEGPQGAETESAAEFLEMTVEEALRRRDSTVRKLLLDRRFAK